MIRFVIAFVLSILFSSLLFAAEKAGDRPDLKMQLISVLQDLTDNIEGLNNIQKQMDNSKEADKKYDQRKNIWLSSVLTFAAISSVCEYENDLLELFLDLRPENRKRFVNVRIRSIEASIRQIEIFKDQIAINRALLGKNKSNQQLFIIEDRIIKTSISLLRKSISIVSVL